MLIICWDYDGTLVSSEKIYKNIFVKYLKESKFALKEIDDEYYFSKYAGRHPFTVFNQLKEEGYICKNATIDETKFFLTLQKELNTNDDLILTKDIEKVLQEISNIKDIKMAVVTSTYRNDLEAKHDNRSVSILKKYFSIDNNIYICGDIGNKELKPSPNGYIFAYKDIVKKYNIKNSKNILVMVEDSVSGCKSANATKKILKNKVKSIVIGYIVANKYSKPQDLIEAGADVIIETPDELIKFLKSITY